MRKLGYLVLSLWAGLAAADPAPILLKPARVFDGVDPKPHEGWSVVVRGDGSRQPGRAVAPPPTQP